MNKLTRIVGPSYRPLLLTTRTLYARWQDLLWDIRVPERRSVIIVFATRAGRKSERLCSHRQSYDARGGTVRIVEASRGMRNTMRCGTVDFQTCGKGLVAAV